jgi:hypothetical protein
LKENVKPEQWRNIPMPVCDATKQVVTVIDDLRRFSMALDIRLQNLATTLA